jgi:kynureninase
VTTTGLAAGEDEARALDHDDQVGAVRGTASCSRRTTPSRGTELCYLAGNSLGPQTVGVADDVRRELDDWATLVVAGHTSAHRPWGEYDALLRDPMARVVGANPDEVVVMNSLTVNLHLLLASFYRPTAHRYRIVIEDQAFPSDSYAVASHAAFRGYEPRDAIVRLRPRDAERVLRTEDVIDHLVAEADRTALVLLGGLNYLSGQLLDLPAITAAARANGIVVGWDLAHAAGNVELALHDWGPDFAAWCTYKYLNGGPGSPGAAFIHERHLAAELPRLAGWWGTDPAVRFEMRPQLDARTTADAWAVSNPAILSMTPLVASLSVFDDVTMAVARARSVQLTAFLERAIEGAAAKVDVVILTPRDPAARGCQLSVRTPSDPTAVVGALRSVHGVVCDARPPDVLRIAPAPLYSTYLDCWRAADALHEVLR